MATNSTSSSTLPTHSGLTSNQFEALIPDRYSVQKKLVNIREAFKNYLADFVR